MEGREFENFLTLMFDILGYKSKTTKESGDFGADVVLVKNNTKIVIQAKRYTGNVSLDAVQEVHSAKSHYSAHEAWVITNSNFTKAAKELAISSNVRLIARDELIDLIVESQKSTKKNSLLHSI